MVASLSTVLPVRFWYAGYRDGFPEWPGTALSSAVVLYQVEETNQWGTRSLLETSAELVSSISNKPRAYTLVILVKFSVSADAFITAVMTFGSRLRTPIVSHILKRFVSQAIKLYHKL